MESPVDTLETNSFSLPCITSVNSQELILGLIKKLEPLQGLVLKTVYVVSVCYQNYTQTKGETSSLSHSKSFVKAQILRKFEQYRDDQINEGGDVTYYYIYDLEIHGYNHC